jgi:hypothetical protein
MVPAQQWADITDESGESAQLFERQQVRMDKPAKNVWLPTLPTAKGRGIHRAATTSVITLSIRLRATTVIGVFWAKMRLPRH